MLLLNKWIHPLQKSRIGKKNHSDTVLKIIVEGKKDGFKVLMPKESKLAKRIGYTPEEIDSWIESNFDNIYNESY